MVQVKQQGQIGQLDTSPFNGLVIDLVVHVQFEVPHVLVSRSQHGVFHGFPRESLSNGSVATLDRDAPRTMLSDN